MSVTPIPPIVGGLPIAGAAMPLPVPVTGGASFADMLLDGITATDRKMVEADRLTAAFALDDSIPVHQVTYALEQAKLSLELMLQVRDRLLDGYRRVMDMQI
ncbi:flagellar hook-basal body complex protein FliE [Sphingomonas sanxanigenens]|uniref:Flagellar hook-basal body complex protein FliE n=1 Tax=Sphingomonas sanxanigenens DSM 19645 = NX02 TaxID=1123269 RepID=W0AGI1_9SPHN|nr:flagellar hook-basal body complex protein FliE [Sphingomonas sanxanigenens]AHE55652.1 hypothetical protein NX02_19965 [Sphingomonas sanxanigenens DSM 19645 = NX02]